MSPYEQAVRDVEDARRDYRLAVDAVNDAHADYLNAVEELLSLYHTDGITNDACEQCNA
jgi:hypothetical protein